MRLSDGPRRVLETESGMPDPSRHCRYHIHTCIPCMRARRKTQDADGEPCMMIYIESATRPDPSTVRGCECCDWSGVVIRVSASPHCAHYGLRRSCVVISHPAESRSLTMIGRRRTRPGEPWRGRGGGVDAAWAQEPDGFLISACGRRPLSAVRRPTCGLRPTSMRSGSLDAQVAHGRRGRPANQLQYWQSPAFPCTMSNDSAI